MTDFNLPTVNDTYANYLAYLKNRDVSIAGMLDPVYFGADTNIPTNASRLNTTTVGGAKFERYNGAAWVDSATGYAISITGNAATSTKWAATKTIQLTGPVTGTSLGLDGSANVTLATTLATVTAILGGTGQTVYAIGDILAANTTTTLQKIADVAVGNALISGGVGVLPTWGKIALATHVSGTLPIANGGTNLTTYTAGDIVHASATNVLGKLLAVATGNVLLSGGVGAISSWGKVALATHISGTLPIANGGTNLTSYVAGDIVHASATNVLSSLAAVATGNVLLSGGIGAVSSWGKVALATHVSGVLPVANGGTGIAFVGFTGPTAARAYGLPDAPANILTTNAFVTVGQGGTGLNTLTAKNLVVGNGASTPTFIAPGASGNMLTSNGTDFVSQAPPKRKNIIINGAFDIWQRGTSFAAVANNTYTADRWAYVKIGAMVHTVSQSTDVPTVAQSGRLFNYSLLADCTTVDASIAIGDYAAIWQRVEGYNWATLAQKICTVGFWVKATKTGIHCVSLSNGLDRAYVAEFTINTTATWEYKTVTFAASPSAGTWNYTNGTGVYLIFALAVGGTFQTSANAWQTGNFFATSSQVNACDSTANDFRICGVQLESGSVATELEQRTFQEELALCQRYFEKSYDYATALGTGTSAGMAYQLFSGAGVTTNYIHQKFVVTKRTTPTITVYSPATGVAGNIYDYSAGADVGGAVGAQTADSGFALGGITVAAGCNWGGHWVALAEL